MNIKPTDFQAGNINVNKKPGISPKRETSPVVINDGFSVSKNMENPVIPAKPPQFADSKTVKESSLSQEINDKSEDKAKPDTFVFVLNSSGETNCCKSLIASVKNKGYKVKVIHFRKNSKEILTSQGILGEEDFIDGTNAMYLPRVKSIFKNEINPDKVVKLVGTPHHAYCRFAFDRANKEGIPTVAIVDMGVPGTAFGHRHTFYKTLTMADDIIVPNDSVRKTLEKRCDEVKNKSGFDIDKGKISTGGNPGFEAFKQLVELNRGKADEIRSELNIGKDDLVFSFSSQPTPNNGKNLEILSGALDLLSKKHPGKKIHALMCPHPRDLYKVGLKNLFGTESGINITEKVDLLKSKVSQNPNVVVHEMPKYAMEKASAISNIVLTESSTTAYECAHCDIPSLFVRTPQQGTGGAFPGFNRIKAGQTPDKLADLMDETMKNPPENLSSDLGKVITSDLNSYLGVLIEE